MLKIFWKVRLPDRSWIMRSDLPVGRNQRGQAVGLGLSNDDAIEWIAGPLFIECDRGDLREGEIANSHSDLGLYFDLRVAG